MIHVWELVFSQFIWTCFGFYWGQKYHDILGFVLAVVGFLMIEYAAYWAIHNHLVIR